MLKVPDRAIEPGHEIVLVKKTHTHGSQAVGSLYRWSYKRLPRNEAIVKALDALVRDYPNEKRTDWEVSTDNREHDSVEADR